MNKLLKKYDLNSDMQYFELIVESIFNGQFRQATELFLDMPKKYRKSFVKSALTNWNSGLKTETIVTFIDLI